jgi:methionyl-tRNA synthetase
MPENHDTDFNWPDFVEKVNSELIAAYGNFVHRVLTLGAKLPAPKSGESPFEAYKEHPSLEQHRHHLEAAMEEITTSLQRHRYKEALRSIMNVAQYGNQILQSAAPWKHLKTHQDGHEESLATLAFCWRITRFLAVATQPFLPTSAQRLWDMLGCEGLVEDYRWSDATDWNAELSWKDGAAEPLFARLDLDEILAIEEDLVENSSEESSPVHGVKGGKKKGVKQMNENIEGVTYLDFDTFMKVELRTGHIKEVNDHPNADKLYVVTLDDGSDKDRTICAGLKEYYAPDEMVGKSVVFVSNLKPRALRGVLSEGMMLAADDGKGNVKLITVDGDIETGSEVR